jgi:hypothetical protein
MSKPGRVDLVVIVPPRNLQEGTFSLSPDAPQSVDVQFPLIIRPRFTFVCRASAPKAHVTRTPQLALVTCARDYGAKLPVDWKSTMALLFAACAGPALSKSDS